MTEKSTHPQAIPFPQLSPAADEGSKLSEGWNMVEVPTDIQGEEEYSTPQRLHTPPALPVRSVVKPRELPAWPTLQKAKASGTAGTGKAAGLKPLLLPAVPTSVTPETTSKGAMFRKKLPMRMSPVPSPPPARDPRASEQGSKHKREESWLLTPSAPRAGKQAEATPSGQEQALGVCSETAGPADTHIPAAASSPHSVAKIPGLRLSFDFLRQTPPALRQPQDPTATLANEDRHPSSTGRGSHPPTVSTATREALASLPVKSSGSRASQTNAESKAAAPTAVEFLADRLQAGDSHASSVASATEGSKDGEDHKVGEVAGEIVASIGRETGGGVGSLAALGPGDSDRMLDQGTGAEGTDPMRLSPARGGSEFSRASSDIGDRSPGPPVWVGQPASTTPNPAAKPHTPSWKIPTVVSRPTSTPKLTGRKRSAQTATPSRSLHRLSVGGVPKPSETTVSQPETPSGAISAAEEVNSAPEVSELGVAMRRMGIPSTAELPEAPTAPVVNVGRRSGQEVGAALQRMQRLQKEANSMLKALNLGGSDILDSDRDLQVLKQGHTEVQAHEHGALTSRRFQQAYASPRVPRPTPRTAMSENLAKLRHLMALQEQGHRFAALGEAATQQAAW